MAAKTLSAPRALLLLVFLLSAFVVHQLLKQSLLLDFLFDPFLADGNKDAPLVFGQHPLAKATIAYAVTFTECKENQTAYLDGATVLSYSIRKHSIRGTNASQYDYKLFAFLHANASHCAEPLEKIGYNVQMKPLPVEVEDIQGDLKKHVHVASCCGASEFIKLYAYTLVEYPVVVHLDTDFLITKPLDVLFDSMIEGPSSQARQQLPVMWKNESMPESIDAFFTRDYNMMAFPGHRTIPQTAVQGGFLVVRPNMTMFEIFKDIIREGVYARGSGWGKLQYGGYYGAAQMQGFLPYVYGHIRPGTALELNRCYINNMADMPLRGGDGPNAKKCMTGEETCQDCRETPMQEIFAIHYTVCTKPWKCYFHTLPQCQLFHKEWFNYRHEMELGWSSRYHSFNTTAARAGQPLALDRNLSLSDGRMIFCPTSSGKKKYAPIQFPNVSHNVY